ncbi:hypothetical protein [Streptomyces sp. H27-H1]|uniref:hypothetical protein n=1 Tax=Streptomyces sp. H27-H1 TaxID=2996461 RepID=UPI002D1E3B13|nr:hypothetical protein [Streptomyces sp. H27-H1]
MTPGFSTGFSTGFSAGLDADGLALGEGTALGDRPGVGVVRGVFEGVLEGGFDAGADGSAGSSDRVTHGPGAKGMSLSSATASFGAMLMPTKTAVGMAASAIVLPTGIWILVSSDFLGAA